MPKRLHKAATLASSCNAKATNSSRSDIGEFTFHGTRSTPVKGELIVPESVTYVLGHLLPMSPVRTHSGGGLGWGHFRQCEPVKQPISALGIGGAAYVQVV